MTLKFTHVNQGNGNGIQLPCSVTDILKTDCLGPCVAVCGFDGSRAFMIHSDSMNQSGIGKIDLITGIRKIYNSKEIPPLTIKLIGGSAKNVATFLSNNLPNAEVSVLEECDTAYIRGDGLVARTKREFK